MNKKLDKVANMVNEFPSLTSRLGVLEFSSDQLTNIGIYICLNEFESYVYGVISQYSRIIDSEQKLFSGPPSPHLLDQQKLDIYYYTLTWDKLKKVFAELRKDINIALRHPNTLPSEFKHDFKQANVRIEHLFGELSTSARNEYEHPSLHPSRIGNLVGFGNSTSDNQGNIKTHVGNEEFAIVRKEHVDRLIALWIEFIDIFIKHFTDKVSTSEVLLLKRQIEENVDKIIGTYKLYRMEKKDKEADQIFLQILMSETYLSREGSPLRQDVVDKFYSILTPWKET